MHVGVNQSSVSGATLQALRDCRSIASRHQLSRSGYAPLTVQAAVWIVTHASGFADAVQSSIELAGPENYCPVLVGYARVWTDTSSACTCSIMDIDT
jgi:hypothetical protein